MTTDSHYTKMKAFNEKTGREVEIKEQKVKEIQVLVDLDGQLMNVGQEAQIFMSGLAVQIAKASTLLDAIEQYRKDPKLRAIAKEQIEVYKGYVRTYIEPLKSYVEGLYKIGILDPAIKAGEIFKKAQALIDKKSEYERDP